MFVQKDCAWAGFFTNIARVVRRRRSKAIVVLDNKKLDKTKIDSTFLLLEINGAIKNAGIEQFFRKESCKN
ncbi:hypothetical protein [Methylobacter sp.]|uniref:hypothetical protein n=1 Tax=Methylobacter sp. TaxID=2051955 RepID=UPI003DA29F9C